ncbi:MAG: hypothetical protein ACE5LH_01845 [Fidelibacterota bacterium]
MEKWRDGGLEYWGNGEMEIWGIGERDNWITGERFSNNQLSIINYQSSAFSVVDGKSR